MSDNVESYVSPICLPWNSKDPGYSTTAGQELTATGWETATNNKDMVNEVKSSIMILKYGFHQHLMALLTNHFITFRIIWEQQKEF